jgi:hypothetical protein
LAFFLKKNNGYAHKLLLKWAIFPPIFYDQNISKFLTFVAGDNVPSLPSPTSVGPQPGKPGAFKG